MNGEHVEVECGPRVEAETVEVADDIGVVGVVRGDPEHPVKVRQTLEDEAREPPVAIRNVSSMDRDTEARLT